MQSSMPAKLPELCNLHQLAEKQATMSGVISISKMDRLTSMLASDAGEACVELEFGKSGATRFVKGTISAQVDMVCQRCMQPMSFKLETDFQLALITDESLVDRIPEEYEPLVTEGEHSLSDLIEDELILAVPLIASHEEDNCSVYLAEQADRQQQERQQAELNTEKADKPNPFAVLKDML